MGLPPLLSMEYALGFLLPEDDIESSLGSGDGDFCRTVRRTRFIILLKQLLKQAHQHLLSHTPASSLGRGDSASDMGGVMGSEYIFTVLLFDLYEISAMNAVSLTGSFLSSLLFKLKNVPGDAVSGAG